MGAVERNSDQALTKVAFDRFRASHAARAPNRNVIRNQQELVQMPMGDLQLWIDGQEAGGGDVPAMITDEDQLPTHLWVVRIEDVVHAEEHCRYGAGLETGKIKHTNLTGGGKAHCGGELKFLGGNKVLLNGASGRYGPRSETELREAAIAFRDSGYTVYWTGYDAEANRSNPLVGIALELVA